MELLDYVQIMDTAPARIRSLMQQDNLNQQELADKIGYNFTSISKFLNSRSPLSDKFLRLVEDKLGWSQRWLRTGNGPQRINNQSDESVNTDQSGNQNSSTVNYKGTVLPPDIEIQLLREKVKDLEIGRLKEKSELLEEINKLLREKR